MHRPGGVWQVDVSHATDASKIALAALVGFCRAHGIVQIDCQQNPHVTLASMGAREMPRVLFPNKWSMRNNQPPSWQFSLYWDCDWSDQSTQRD